MWLLAYAWLVTSLVLPRLDYCNSALVGLPATTLASLQQVLHAAVRILFSLRPRDHVTLAFSELHGLPVVKEWIDYKLCLLVHKALVGHAPQYIADMITPVADLPARSSLRAFRSSDLVISRTNHKICNQAFAVAAPRAWNQLPTYLKLRQSTTAFRQHLKTCLFNCAFCSGDTVWLRNALPVYLVGNALQITAVTVTVC